MKAIFVKSVMLYGEINSIALGYVAMARFKRVEFTMFGGGALIAQFFERFHAFEVAASCFFAKRAFG